MENVNLSWSVLAGNFKMPCLPQPDPFFSVKMFSDEDKNEKNWSWTIFKSLFLSGILVFQIYHWSHAMILWCEKFAIDHKLCSPCEVEFKGGG